MPYEPVEQPVLGSRAFEEQSDSFLQSQATILLLLRSQLAFAREYVEARAAAGLPLGQRPEAVGRQATLELAEADLTEFPVPWLRDWGPRFGSGPVDALRRRFGRSMIDEVLEGSPEAVSEVLPPLAHELFDDSQLFAAALVLEVCRQHPDSLVRAAAAGAYMELSEGTQRLSALDTLVDTTFDTDPEVRDVAAALLAGLLPAHPRLVDLGGGGPSDATSGPLRSTLLVHGTWARNQRWWRPGGDFHNYIRTKVRTDLYSRKDCFGWSGRYSDQERALGALDLIDWVRGHGSKKVDVIAHSHGGSVAMMATWGGLKIDELVLLSCPVHWPRRSRGSLRSSNRRYLPDFRRVRRIESIRVHLDRVILADRGGQLFYGVPIHENPPVGWFHHGLTHDPSTWQRYGVDRWI